MSKVPRSQGDASLTATIALARALATASLVVALDQATKQIAIANVERGSPVEVIFGFEISNVRNRGIAFGLLDGGGDAVLLLTGATLAAVLIFFVLNLRRSWLWLAVGLLAGGATGNLADRARLGAAIDFLDPPLWPAFNLADVAIVVGVLVLAGLIVATPRDHGR